MIAVTAFTMGFLAVTLRSVLSYALAGCGILVAFGLAALATAGVVSWVGLALALLSYNAGIAGGAICVAVVFRTRQIS